MKRITVYSLFVLLIMIAVQPSGAGQPAQLRKKPPLPPLPDQTVIDDVVSLTGGANYEPLTVPASVIAELEAFGSPFSDVVLDTTRAVHYIDSAGTLRETIIPAADLRTAPLAATFTAPGSDPVPGMVIGALFRPSHGVRFIVATFKEHTRDDVEKIRLYRKPNKYDEQTAKVGIFEDDDNDSAVDTVDDGASMSFKHSCITVGLHQVCWRVKAKDGGREKAKPNAKVGKALGAFRSLYKFGSDIDIKHAVPDILGKSERELCRASLATATAFVKMAACKPNAFFSGAKAVVPGTPIGLLVLRSPADIRAFDSSGVPIDGGLPKGKYLVMATPSVDTDAGTPTALFLIGLNGVNYLVPSRIMEGFGVGVQGDTQAAGIRDGFVGYRLFGW